MLMLASWLARYGRLGLQANVDCLGGHCCDAALTRFVYCLLLSRKVMACVSCAVFLFLNLRAVTMVAYLTDVATFCSPICLVMFPYRLWPCAVRLPK